MQIRKLRSKAKKRNAQSQVRKAGRVRPQFRNRKGDSRRQGALFLAKLPGGGEGKAKVKVGEGCGRKDGGFQRKRVFLKGATGIQLPVLEKEAQPPPPHHSLWLLCL